MIYIHNKFDIVGVFPVVHITVSSIGTKMKEKGIIIM
jgi:hypothetical protein